jgi:hypothetical protein
MHTIPYRNCSPLGIEPKYLTAKKKKDVILMDWDFETFKSVLQRGANKEENKAFSIDGIEDLDDRLVELY